MKRIAPLGGPRLDGTASLAKDATARAVRQISVHLHGREAATAAAVSATAPGAPGSAVNVEVVFRTAGAYQLVTHGLGRVARGFHVVSGSAIVEQDPNDAGALSATASNTTKRGGPQPTATNPTPTQTIRLKQTSGSGAIAVALAIF